MEHADFEKIAVDAARQWLSSSESEHALTGEKPFVPTYLNNCRNNTWHPHAWVVNAVKTAFSAGFALASTARFENQEKIDDEKTQTSVEKPSGLENPVVDAARRAVADTVIHEAFVLALTMRDDPENTTATKDHFVELVQAAVAPPADFDISFLIAAVEDYHQGVQQHMVRAAVAAVLEAKKSIKKEVRGWPRGQGPVTVTINLDAQATIWDRMWLTNRFNPDNTITYTAYTISKKEPSL